jgi:glycosyltransferase involved in cell wall biosynthesis
MRIAINTVVSPASNQIGVGAYVRNLIAALISLTPIQSVVAVVSKTEPLISFEADNLQLIYTEAVPQPSVKLALWQKSFDQIAKDTRSDVYHVPNTAPVYVKSSATVCSILDLQEYRIRKYGLIQTLYRRTVNRWIAKHADTIVTISKQSKKDIVETFQVSPDKVFVTYLAADPIYRTLERDLAKFQVMSKFGIDRYIIVVGDLQPAKNLVRLVQAYALLRSSGETRKLVLVGKERGVYQALHAEIRARGLTEMVMLLGYVAIEDLVILYNAADLCVLPSLYEGFGLTILEAMACGVPVATSRTSSMPEVGGDSAVYFDPYDVSDIARAMSIVLDSRETQSGFAEKGLSRCKLFSWQRCAKETVDAYEQAKKIFVGSRH